MSATKRIQRYRLTGWVLRILAVSLLVILGVYVASSISTALQNSTKFFSWAQIIILVLVGAGLTDWFGGHVFKMANEQDKSINERLFGFVTTANAVSFDDLAKWTRIEHQEAVDRLAKIASKGSLRDFIIDVTHGIVVRGQKPLESLDSRPGPPSSQISAAPEPIVGPDEAIKVKAKLYELDVLKQQGKISQKSYDKLKEEYEKKLAQADSGTQVY